MRAWHFSETAYPYLPPAETYPSIRVSLPNRHFDPKKGAALWDRYLDEWCIAEDEGVDVMLNEHHQTATCVDPANFPNALAATNPAGTLSWNRLPPCGSTAVTPVWTLRPRSIVTCPTFTPATSVIALSGPGWRMPGAMLSSRARGAAPAGAATSAATSSARITGG